MANSCFECSLENSKHYRSNLNILYFLDLLEAAHLDVYKKFVAHSDQVLTHQGRKTALVIPTDAATHDKLIDYMEQVSIDFRDMLWNGQNANPI